jgi:hypothetical protein
MMSLVIAGFPIASLVEMPQGYQRFPRGIYRKVTEQQIASKPRCR